MLKHDSLPFVWPAGFSVVCVRQAPSCLSLDMMCMSSIVLNTVLNVSCVVSLRFLGMRTESDSQMAKRNLH